MDDTLPRRFFEQPSCPRQRQYEALRAVFLDGLSQKEAAGRFGYSYDAFRQLLGQFRVDSTAGIVPPFLPSRPAVGGRQSRPPLRRPAPTSRRSPTQRR